MSVLMEIPRMICPLRLPFRSMRDVFDHCEQAYGPQGEPWRRDEYIRARRLARLGLEELFSCFTAGDLSALRWESIAGEVRALTHLAENPR